MLELYRFSEAVLLMLTMSSALCLIAQALVISVSINRYKNTAARWVECAAEVLVFLNVLILALLISQVFVNLRAGIIAVSGYVLVRYLLFAAIVTAVIAVNLLRRKRPPLLPALAVFLPLPFMEAAAGHHYPSIFIVVMIFWLLRAIYICIVRHNEMKRQISAFSIKQAIDSLRTGLLYYDSRGRIYLMNHRMLLLMPVLTGAVQKNGVTFRRMIECGDTLTAPEPLPIDGHIIYRLNDGTAWLFREQEVLISNKTYYQLSAVDVTERLRLTYKRQEYAQELTLRGKQIADTIENLDSICREEELLRISNDIHDDIAQRLAMMARILRANEEIDETALAEYVGGIATGWKNIQTENCEESIASLCHAYADIGVMVTLHGEVPKNTAVAEYFVDFVREGVANAVRHGFTSEVLICCEEDADTLKMSVKNGSLALKGEIVEGSGIAGLRRKLAVLGGTIEIITSPHFTLTAVIATVNKTLGGRENDG